MYLILSIFFISLVGSITMLLKKVALVRQSGYNERGAEEIYIFPDADPETIKRALKETSRKYGYLMVFNALRTYMIVSKTLRKGAEKTIEKVSSVLYKKTAGTKSKAVSSFLKSVSEYKKRLAHMKQKIREEENL